MYKFTHVAPISIFPSTQCRFLRFACTWLKEKSLASGSQQGYSWLMQIHARHNAKQLVAKAQVKASKATGKRLN